MAMQTTAGSAGIGATLLNVFNRAVDTTAAAGAQYLANKANPPALQVPATAAPVTPAATNASAVVTPRPPWLPWAIGGGVVVAVLALVAVFRR